MKERKIMLSEQEILKAIKFYTNEEKRIVVGKISGDTLINLYDGILEFYCWDKTKKEAHDMVRAICAAKIIIGRYKDGITVKANCHEEDEFDEVIGMAICEQRMIRKIRHIEYCIEVEIMNTLRDFMEAEDKTFLKVYHQYERANESLNSALDFLRA